MPQSNLDLLKYLIEFLNQITDSSGKQTVIARENINFLCDIHNLANQVVFNVFLWYLAYSCCFNSLSSNIAFRFFSQSFDNNDPLH